MLTFWIVLAAIAVATAAWLVWRSVGRSTIRQKAPLQVPGTDLAADDEFPVSGLLVPDDVFESAGSTSTALWDALEAAACPVAVEYHPASDAEIAKFRQVPVSKVDQEAIGTIVNSLRPKSQTVFTVTLPKGAKLVRAKGTSGYRGFSRSAGKTQHAVLNPVSAGAKVGKSLPKLALSATTLAVDVMAQQQQLAHQRHVETMLGRQEERAYLERVKEQRSADAQLSRAISLLLDGREAHMELALKTANDEFLRAHDFIERFRGTIETIVDADGKVDYHRLDQVLGGKPPEVEHFVREFHLARAAMAIKRKALVADAAANAIADPENPYRALRRFLDTEAQQLDQASTDLADLAEQLTTIDLKGRWYNRDKSVSERQTRLRELIAEPEMDLDSETHYLVTDSGEIVRLLPSGERDEYGETVELDQHGSKNGSTDGDPA